eukprot:scaffold35485_cov76-Phaeocystis_antarctica.AAC.6
MSASGERALSAIVRAVVTRGCASGGFAARIASAWSMTSGDASHPAAATSGSCACESSKRRAASCENGTISAAFGK